MRLHVLRSCRVIVGISVALCSWINPAVAQSAKDPLVGTWVLDRGKSDFVPDNATLQKRIMIFKVVENGLNCVIKTENTRGEVVESSYTAKYDGKDAPIDVSILDTVSLKRVEANTYERTGKIKGKAVETATMKVSPDGKKLTVTTSGSVEGTDYSSTQVFDRQ